MSKITLPTSNELLLFWRKGWPGYVITPQEDHNGITEMYLEAAKIANEQLETGESQHRIKIAITAIAAYCYCSDEFAKKNIRYINKAFARVIHEMQYEKRNTKLNEHIQSFKDYYDFDKRKAQENERLLKEHEAANRKWHEENWTPELEEEYNTWRKNHGIIKVGDLEFKTY